MHIEYKKVLKVNELTDMIHHRGGATWSSLWQVFYYTRMFKYVHKRHYPKIKTLYNKVCTHRNLQKLCELGYFKNPQPEIYCATNKVLPILKEAGFKIELLPEEAQGKGDINELSNTDVFIESSKLKYFNTLLYYNFGYLIPDALLVQLDKDSRRYKLTFLEIEAKKPDWENYIEKKRDSYLRLAEDIQFYEKWKRSCKLLNLAEPHQSTLKFSVCFIGNIKKDFGKYFTFTDNVRSL